MTARVPPLIAQRMQGRQAATPLASPFSTRAASHPDGTLPLQTP